MGGLERSHATDGLVQSQNVREGGSACGSSERISGLEDKQGRTRHEWSSREVLLTDGLTCQLPMLIRAGMVQQSGDDRLADGTRFRCTAEKAFVEQVGRADHCLICLSLAIGQHG